MLVNLLIIFFLFLIVYQFLAPSFKEGLETAPGPYMEYPNDPMILGKQNAGNIEVLRAEVQKVSTLEPRVLQLETDVKNLNEQLAGIQQQNSEAVSSFGDSMGGLTGSKEEEGDGEVVPGEGATEEEGEDSGWGNSFGMGGGEEEEGEENKEGESSSSSWGFGGSESFQNRNQNQNQNQNKFILKHYF